MVTYIVACGSKKLEYPAKAKDMYVGGYFKSCLKYAQCFGSCIFILSAKYGLLKLDEIIEPYNLTFGNENSISVEKVQQQASDFEILEDEIVILGGKKYVKFAEKIWGDVTCPLIGGMFQQLSWINKEIEKVNKKRSLF